VRFLGDWRNLLFGAILLAMNIRPRDSSMRRDRRYQTHAIEQGAGNARTQGLSNISAACAPSTSRLNVPQGECFA